jgi:putative ABC transport system ATP-binding protein
VTTTPQQHPALRLDDVHFDYARTPALRGVSLTVMAGEVVAVTGRSGSGKSTLLHVAAGLLRPQTGRVVVGGRDLSSLRDDEASALRRREVGIVLQHGQLVPELSVVDNVALPLLLDGGEHRVARAVAADWLHRVGAGDLGPVTPPQLSGGQSQRVAVARALAADPSLVLADEPTGSMDALGGEQLLDLLLAVCREGGRALVVVTHDNRVAAAADREIRVADGVIEYDAVLR